MRLLQIPSLPPETYAARPTTGAYDDTLALEYAAMRRGKAEADSDLLLHAVLLPAY